MTQTVAAIAVGVPCYVTNKLTEDLTQGASPTVKKVAAVVGAAIIASPVIVPLGFFGGIAAIGAGIGIVTGAIQSESENKESRERGSSSLSDFINNPSDIVQQGVEQNGRANAWRSHSKAMSDYRCRQIQNSPPPARMQSWVVRRSEIKDKSYP